jgi:glycosyltransferase involved in cell wall biosynthesis
MSEAENAAKGDSSSIKALIYTHGFVPIIGGAEKYVMLLAQGLAESATLGRAIDVTVATPTPADSFDDSRLPFKVVRQPSFFSLARLVMNADLIHLSGACLLPLAFARILGKPVLIEHHGYTASCPNGLLFYEPTQSICPDNFLKGHYGECLKCNWQKQSWLSSAKALLLTFPRRWLSQTAAINAPITEHVLHRLALAHSQVIYYGIPDAAPAPSSTRATQTDPLCFAFVGRLVALKGLPVLFEAAKMLKDQGRAFRLKIIGDGPDRVNLESLANSLQLNGIVEFTGFTSGDGFDKQMRDVSAVIMPSIWEETAGLAAIEQMMRARLVIASDVGGLGEVVGEAGLKCAPGDPASLANCMKQVLDHPEIVDGLGAAARARALSLFPQRRMVEKHIEVYQQLAAAKRVQGAALDPS